MDDRSDHQFNWQHGNACFAHTHSGAVEELNEKAVGAVHLGDDGVNFLGDEDGGEVSGLSGTNGVDVGEFYF